MTTHPNRKNDRHRFLTDQVGGLKIPYSIYQTQGRPDYMEDFFHHEVALRGTPLECSLFAVFDGHRGGNTGRFCVENLPRMIVEEIRRSCKERQQEQQEQNEDKEETAASNPSKPDMALASLDMKGIFEKVFLDCDQQILEIGHEDGSTASVVVIQGRNVWIANLGDTRVILARLGKAIALTKDHRPNDPSEKERIIKTGGHVSYSLSKQPRLNGVLATSRAFGDKDLKASLSAVPDVRLHVADPGDEFLVIASDGVWDYAGNHCVVQTLVGAKSIKSASKDILEMALVRGGSDNISVCVIDMRCMFGIATKETVEKEGILAKMGRRLSFTSSPAMGGSAVGGRRSSIKRSSITVDHIPDGVPFVAVYPSMLAFSVTTKEGWLWKRQRNSALGADNFQRRWFLLYHVQGGLAGQMVFLRYFKSAEDAATKGHDPDNFDERKCCPLQLSYTPRLEAGNDVSEISGNKYAWSLQDGSTQEVWLLFADTAEVAQDWVDAVAAAMSAKNMAQSHY